MKKHLALMLGGLSLFGGCGGASSAPPQQQPAGLSLAPASLSFGELVVGTTSVPQAETLTNTGGSALAIDSVATTGTNAAEFNQTSTTCGASLVAGASCTINMSFLPAQAGPRSAAIMISDDIVGSPQSVSLSGIGLTTGPNATFSGISLPFGAQLVGTTSPPQSVALNNYGTMTLNIASITVTGNFAETDNCVPSLAPGATCTINVTFTPSETGDLSGALSAADDAAGSPALKRLASAVQLRPWPPFFSMV